MKTRITPIPMTNPMQMMNHGINAITNAKRPTVQASMLLFCKKSPEITDRLLKMKADKFQKEHQVWGLGDNSYSNAKII